MHAALRAGKDAAGVNRVRGCELVQVREKKTEPASTAKEDASWFKRGKKGTGQRALENATWVKHGKD